MNWIAYSDHHDVHTVVGDLLVYRDLASARLGNVRDILVWVPPSYDQGSCRYPVIYMHDGQNLFDAHTSYAGEWHVDETMLALSAERYEAIIVGIPNMGAQRIDEYTPFRDRRAGGGHGDAYITWLFNRVKPLIDDSFRTMPDVSHTGIMGSSLGGLISLYGILKYPDIFGFAGVMSPSLWFADGEIFKLLEQQRAPHGRIYLDMGGHEAARRLPFDLANPALRGARRLNLRLQQLGYTPGYSLWYREDSRAGHTESAWAARLPDALRFLLDPFRSDLPHLANAQPSLMSD